MLKRRQTGFTLVELMVAMAIGSIIILGAGQLFLSTFQTFRTVNELSRKQETVIFAANNLVNAYRRGGEEYTLKPTTDTPEECSIQANGEPIVGGLARFDGECSAERFISAVEVASGQTLDGYHRFTFDFGRDDEQLETLSFHVMERRLVKTDSQEEQQYQIGTGDAIIAGSNVNNVGEDLLKEDSKVSQNLGSNYIPDPRAGGGNNSTGYIDKIKTMDNVKQSCDSSAMASFEASIIYCSSNINGLNVEGLDGKVIIANNGIELNQNGNSTVNDLVVVAGGAINIKGSNQNAYFNGVIWGGENIAMDASGVNYKGVVIAGNGVNQNNTSSITSDWNALGLLSVPGYEFSMYEKFKELGILEDLHEAEESE